MAEHWDIQGFLTDYGNGRAAWSVGVDSPAKALAYLATALNDSDAHAWLVRRGPRVEAADGTVGPWRLVSTDARERLARHLYLASVGADWRDHHELLWDRRSERIDFDAVYARADELLAVIAGNG